MTIALQGNEKKNFMIAMEAYLEDQGAPVVDGANDDLLYYQVDMSDFDEDNSNTYEAHISRDDFEYIAEHQHGDMIESWESEGDIAITLDNGDKLEDLEEVESYYGIENIVSDLDISTDDAYEIIDWYKYNG